MVTRNLSSLILLIAITIPPGQLLARETLLLPSSEQRSHADVVTRDMWAERSAYFGKRSRLAQLNPSVLFSEEPFDIELYDDVVITVRRTELRQNVPNSWVWSGQQVNPRMPVWLHDGRELTPEQQKELEDDAHRVEFLIIRTDDPRPSDFEVEEREVTKEPLPTFGTTSPLVARSRAEQQSMSPGGTYVISGLVSTPGIDHQYKIEPIDSSPTSLLVVELDPEKFFLVPEAGGIAQESDENKERRLRYQEFIDRQKATRGLSND